jgi:serine O-acetyltransferase
VTLGGTGKESGDRHPKIRRGVLLSVGAKVLGNVEVGEGAKIGAGSVVLCDIPPHSTAVGIPAKVVGRAVEEKPALEMDHTLPLDYSI